MSVVIPRTNCLRDPAIAYLIVTLTDYQNPGGANIPLNWRIESDGSTCEADQNLVTTYLHSPAVVTTAELAEQLAQIATLNWGVPATASGSTITYELDLSTYPCACDPLVYTIGDETLPEGVVLTYEARIECCPGARTNPCDDCDATVTYDPCTELIRADAAVVDDAACLTPCTDPPGFAHLRITFNDFQNTTTDPVVLNWSFAGPGGCAGDIVDSITPLAINWGLENFIAAFLSRVQSGFYPSATRDGNTVIIPIALIGQNNCACDIDLYNFGTETLPEGTTVNYTPELVCCGACSDPGVYATYTGTVTAYANPAGEAFQVSIRITNLADPLSCNDIMVTANFPPAGATTPDDAALFLANSVDAPHIGQWNGDNTFTVYVLLADAPCACDVTNYQVVITPPADPGFEMTLDQSVTCCDNPQDPQGVFETLAEATLATPPQAGSTYAWSQTFGPTTGVTITTPSANETTVTGLGPGLYQFTVTITRQDCDREETDTVWLLVTECGQCQRAWAIEVGAVDTSFVGDIDFTFAAPGCVLNPPLSFTLSPNAWTAEQYAVAIVEALTGLAGVATYYGEGAAFTFFTPCTELCPCTVEEQAAPVLVTLTSATPGYDETLFTVTAWTACDNG